MVNMMGNQILLTVVKIVASRRTYRKLLPNKSYIPIGKITLFKTLYYPSGHKSDIYGVCEHEG